MCTDKLYAVSQFFFYCNNSPGFNLIYSKVAFCFAPPLDSFKQSTCSVCSPLFSGGKYVIKMNMGIYIRRQDEFALQIDDFTVRGGNTGTDFLKYSMVCLLYTSDAADEPSRV